MKSLMVLLLLSASAGAQVYAYFKGDPTAQPHYMSDYVAYVQGQPTVAGITVGISWADYDNTNCSGTPALNISALETTLDPHLNAAADGGTINLIVSAASGDVGVSGVNTATPCYVFSTTWAAACGSCTPSTPPVDTCDCSNYQGSNYANLQSNCTNINNPNGKFDINGVPAAWEVPFYSAYETWLASLINYYTSISPLLKGRVGYIRVGVGTGGGSYIPCPNVEAGSFMGYGGQPMQSMAPFTKLTRAVWRTYNSGVYAAVAGDSPGPIILEASMYCCDNIGSGNGTTPIQWADDVAQEAVDAGLGIGAESLAASDLGFYASASACSNDWCSLFNQYFLVAPMLGLQTFSISNPACLATPSCGDQNRLVGYDTAVRNPEAR